MKPITVEVDYLERPFTVARKFDDLNRTNRYRMNWIHRAAAAHHWRDIAAVLGHVHKEGSANVVRLVEQRDTLGQTPLFHACIKEANSNRLQTIKVLLNNQATFRNLRSEESGWTIPHWLAANNDLDSLQYLENNGMCCFLPDKKGNFAIDIAGLKGNDKIVAFLIKNFLTLRKEALARVEVKKKALKERDPKAENIDTQLDVDEYHDYFLASEYLYTVVTYWALYFNRTTKDLLPGDTGGFLESVGVLIGMTDSRGSNTGSQEEKKGEKKEKDQKDTEEKKKISSIGTDRANTEAQPLKDPDFHELLIDRIPPITMRIPTLGYNNMFHAASASESSKGLTKLFKIIPKYIKQDLPLAEDMIFLPKNHPFDMKFMSYLDNELESIKKDRVRNIVPNQPERRAYLGLNDWESTNDLGETPLHIATRRRRAVNVKLLLDQGADFLATNRNYWTPPNLAMDEFTVEAYVSWFKKLRETHVKGETYYLKRTWVQEKHLIKNTGCCRRRPRIYVENMKEQIKSEVESLSANMLFTTESSTFYYLAMRIRVNPSMSLQDKMVAAERADYIIDTLVNLGYRATLVTSTVPESYLLLVHASNKKLNQVDRVLVLDLYRQRNS